MDDEPEPEFSFKQHAEAGPATIDGWRIGDVTVVLVQGEVDASNVHVLRRLIGDAMQDGSHPLVLDFTSTAYVDSSATALVASLAAELRAKRSSLTVVAPSPSPARRVFEVSGLAAEVEMREKRGDLPSPPP